MLFAPKERGHVLVEYAIILAFVANRGNQCGAFAGFQSWQHIR